MHQGDRPTSLLAAGPPCQAGRQAGGQAGAGSSLYLKLKWDAAEPLVIHAAYAEQ